MQSLGSVLNGLEEIAHHDGGILTLFVHGSIVSGRTTRDNYQEIRILEGSTFWCSVFILKELAPDIDVVCVSQAPDQTAETIKSRLRPPSEYYITINLVSQHVFERDIASAPPKALKRVVALTECITLVGQDYFRDSMAIARASTTQLDVRFQKEFRKRKTFLRCQVPRTTFILTAARYSRLFPLFYQFVRGEIDCGFPPERHKIVLPQPMNLKAVVDLGSGSFSYAR